MKELKGLNGLRAVAVILVIIYHFSPNILPGGFLGVDLFFVLSGYLITSILIEKNNLNIIEFYYKRFKRLFPVSFTMLIILIVILGLTNTEWLLKERSNILHSFIYNSNLHSVLSKSSYFDNFTIASPVKHLWSLAIEMKFYIFFPLIFLTKFGRKYIREILITLCVISLLTLNVLYIVDSKNLSIIYYLLITRIYALCIGGIFATFISLSKLSRMNIPLLSKVLGFILLGLSIFTMTFIDEQSVFLYKYLGVLGYSIIFGFIILFLSRSKILGLFNYIGKLSYSVYIWHYVIFVLTTPYEEYLEPNFNNAMLRIAITFLISILSFHFIEEPIRKNGFKKYFENSAVSMAALLLFVFSSISLSGMDLELWSYRLIDEKEVGLQSLDLNVDKINVEIEKPKVEEEVAVETKQKINRVLMLGDSLGINIAYAWAKVLPILEVDAQTGRFFFDAIELANKYKKYNSPDSNVVIMLGTNGPITLEQLESIRNKFSKANLFFININVPRKWNNGVNSVLKEAKNKYDDITIIDWNSLSKGHPEYFRKDKVHVNEVGAEVLIKEIMKVMDSEYNIPENAKPKLHIEHELRSNKKK
ncbi:acyltransferase family protein [Streptobacillus felis]|uniref:acyltransferase family protein n=1 Tax=Streptobacillus felis TaxID=1384509 RepID=UPI00082B992F|nr:acyltransferase family protein [Streptobacillus felis]